MLTRGGMPCLFVCLFGKSQDALLDLLEIVVVSCILSPYWHCCGGATVMLFLWVLLKQVKIDSFIKFNILLFVCKNNRKQKIDKKLNPGYPIKESFPAQHRLEHNFLKLIMFLTWLEAAPA